MTTTAWAICTLCGWIVLTSWSGVIWPYPTIVLQAVGPIALALAWVAVGVALAQRRRMLSIVAGALCIAHIVVIAPLVRSDTRPRWAATAPTITVAAANVLYLNRRFDELLRTLALTNADVLVLSEVTPGLAASMLAGDLSATYPYRVLNPYAGAAIGSAILSKRPIVAEHTDKAGQRAVHSVDVTVGRALVRVVATHPQSPSSPDLAASWRDQVGALRRIVDARAGPIVLAGDLNASYLHPPYRHLLGDDLTDAHEAVGRGLTASFPTGGRLVPLTRLDHALVSSDLAVLRVDELVLPGSDHAGFVVRLAVEQPTA